MSPAEILTYLLFYGCPILLAGAIIHYFVKSRILPPNPQNSNSNPTSLTPNPQHEEAMTLQELMGEKTLKESNPSLIREVETIDLDESKRKPRKPKSLKKIMEAKLLNGLENSADFSFELLGKKSGEDGTKVKLLGEEFRVKIKVGDKEKPLEYDEDEEMER